MWLGPDAPALHLLPKTLYNPLDEARALVRAAHGVRFTGELAPVWYGRKLLGSVYGHRDGRVFATTSKQFEFAGFPNGYVDVINAIKNGQTNSSFFTIDMSNGAQSIAWSDCWNCQAGGGPLAYSGAADTARQFNDTTVGAPTIGGNQSPAQKYLLNYNIVGRSDNNLGTMFWLYDRVITYDECLVATTSMDNSLTAQRWVGAGLPGLRLCITGSQTSTGIKVANWTSIVYANEATVGTRNVPFSSTVTCKLSSSANSVVNQPSNVLTQDSLNNPLGPFLALQIGDIGMSSVTSVALDSTNSGTVCYALMRPLCMLLSPGPSHAVTMDAVMERFAMVRIYDGTCLGFLLGIVNEAGLIDVNLNFVWN